ncbi:MAG TPA: alpha/beta hydrolase [Gemmatimonadales bacterium]|jgi:pimeloyl-ACP methyl ester carboxylesterase|nr:alpha/beta hydrolase [Gemmatimonadales bacterium]
MKQRRMDRAALEGIELEYEIRGAGDSVVLIHPGHFADWFTPLLDEPALTDRYRVVSYHRVGCAGSSRVAGPVSLAQHAAHCRSLMLLLGIDRAHVVGHSSSGNVALQLALDAPDVVHSLAILEPALYSVPSAQTSRAFVGAAVQLYRAGDKAGAIDTFLRGVCGPGYRAVLDRTLPGAFDQHVADADTFFEQELPALQQWSFRQEDAKRIIQPALAVVSTRGLELDPIWGERHQLLLDWLPNVESFVLTDATHLLQIENPRGMAEGLAAFFARHPLSASS